jgi:hypothetical protein
MRTNTRRALAILLSGLLFWQPVLLSAAQIGSIDARQILASHVTAAGDALLFAGGKPRRLKKSCWNAGPRAGIAAPSSKNTSP